MTFLDRIKSLTSDPSARAALRKTKVASDLAILISKAQLRRRDVAKRLAVTEAALSSRLNGSANLTLDTIGSICEVAGYDFDVVFRKPGDAHALNSWERELEESAACSNEKGPAPGTSVIKVDGEDWLRSSWGTTRRRYSFDFSPADAANDGSHTRSTHESKPLAA